MKAAEPSTDQTCRRCGADQMGCDVKRGLSGRACCGSCSHDTTEEVY